MSSRVRIGVIGLGEAGSLIAAGLQAAGADVIGFDAVVPETPPVPLAPDVAAVVTGADIVISINSSTAAKKVAEQVAPLLGAGTVYADLNTGITPFADERAFKQILVNLLSNAVKFSPQGGTIDVVCRRLNDGGVRITIGDSGPGIPDDKIASLFRPFERVDNSYGSGAGGTGLGLALVRGLVALHGGRVWVENKSPTGLFAHVELPGRELRAVA